MVNSKSLAKKTNIRYFKGVIYIQDLQLKAFFITTFTKLSNSFWEKKIITDQGLFLLLEIQMLENQPF